MKRPPGLLSAALLRVRLPLPGGVGLKHLAALVALAGALWGVVCGLGPPSAVPAPVSAAGDPAGAPAPASVRFEPVSIPAYPTAPFLRPIHSYDFDMIFQSLDWKAYDAAPRDPEPRTFNGIILENDYLKATVLPELGGRIYDVVFKPTGHNEFYRNPVLKPTRWGPPEQNWWLAAGGMEWCLPVDEHGYETAVPWQFGISRSPEGVTVTVRDTGADDRLRASVDIQLPTDRAYLAISPRLENPTGRGLSLKFWLNAMLAPGGANAPSGQLQFILPTSAMTVHSHDWRWTGLPGPGESLAWPVHDGLDLSVLGNWPYYLGCFERPAAAGDFAAVYDHQVEEGMVRVYPSDVARGTKIFAPGYGPDALQPALWTDDASSYVELHGGLAPTFDDRVTLEAGQAVGWTEYWYPIAGTGGLAYANREAALNLKSTPQGTFAGLATTAAHVDSVLTLRSRASRQTLYQEALPIVSPYHPYRAGPLPTGGLPLDALSLTYTDAAGKVLAEF